MRTPAAVLLSAVLAACAGAPAWTPTTTWHFDDVAPRTLPPGFCIDATRRAGPLASWAVQADANAPSAPHVLSLTYPNHRSYDSFNLCWAKTVRFGDGTLRTRLRAVSGKEDQGGGLIWRAKDAENYYVARLNPLEGNLRLYHVVGGNRTMLASADCTARVGEWHELTVRHEGAHIVCAVDGTTRIELDDATIAGAGGIGFWTKADAATDFDDLQLERR